MFICESIPIIEIIYTADSPSVSFFLINSNWAGLLEFFILPDFLLSASFICSMARSHPSLYVVCNVEAVYQLHSFLRAFHNPSIILFIKLLCLSLILLFLHYGDEPLNENNVNNKQQIEDNIGSLKINF